MAGVSVGDDCFLLAVVRLGAEAEALSVVVDSSGLLTDTDVMELHRDLVE